MIGKSSSSSSSSSSFILTQVTQAKRKMQKHHIYVHCVNWIIRSKTLTITQEKCMILCSHKNFYFPNTLHPPPPQKNRNLGTLNVFGADLSPNLRIKSPPLVLWWRIAKRMATDLSTYWIRLPGVNGEAVERLSQRPICSHLCTSVSKRYNLVPAKGR